MLDRKSKSYEIVCSVCRKHRFVVYASYRKIVTSNNTKCLRCANQKTTHTSFKPGQKPWNYGLKGAQPGYWAGKKRPNISEMMHARQLRGGRAGTCDECGTEIWLTPTRQRHGYHACSRECKRILARKNGVHRGANNPRWKGGITSLALQIRHSTEYKEWRSNIFKRDGFSCQKCGQVGGMLEADHYPDRFADILHNFKLTNFQEAIDCMRLWDITNGRTLCKPCHRLKG